METAAADTARGSAIRGRVNIMMDWVSDLCQTDVPYFLYESAFLSLGLSDRQMPRKAPELDMLTGRINTSSVGLTFLLRPTFVRSNLDHKKTLTRPDDRRGNAIEQFTGTSC